MENIETHLFIDISYIKQKAALDVINYKTTEGGHYLPFVRLEYK